MNGSRSKGEKKGIPAAAPAAPRSTLPSSPGSPAPVLFFLPSFLPGSHPSARGKSRRLSSQPALSPRPDLPATRLPSSWGCSLAAHPCPPRTGRGQRPAGTSSALPLWRAELCGFNSFALLHRAVSEAPEDLALFCTCSSVDWSLEKSISR